MLIPANCGMGGKAGHILIVSISPRLPQVTPSGRPGQATRVPSVGNGQRVIGMDHNSVVRSAGGLGDPRLRGRRWAQAPAVGLRDGAGLVARSTWTSCGCGESPAVKYQKMLNGIEAQTVVVQAGPAFWSDVKVWGMSKGLLPPDDQGILDVAISIPARVPSEKQSLRTIEIFQRLREDGCELEIE